MRAIFSLLVVVTGLAQTCWSQDIHFSQFDMAPQLMNPGLTGVFAGDARVALNYRDQWGSIDNPYRTYAFNYDHRLFHNKWKRVSIAFGLAAFRDEAGDLGLHTTSGVISISGTINLNKEQSLTAGIQSGVLFRGVNTAGMVWGSQYDGQNHDHTMGSGEVSQFNSFIQPDLSLGFAWDFSAPEGFNHFNDLRFTVGTGLLHLNRPEQRFNLGVSDSLHIKWVVHGKGLIGLGTGRSFVVPMVMFALQGPSTEFIFGGMYRYMLKEPARITGFVRGAAISAGATYRWGDAIVPMVLVELDRFAVGISYDVNVSGLAPASAYQGGLEVTLRFISPNPFYFSGRQSQGGLFNLKKKER
jgi:type IX secretion system PorP/SprF family membrane protein